MTDIVFNSGDYATLLDEATTLGFVTTDAEGNEVIQTSGTFESGGGWFLNVVGTIYEPIIPPVDPDNPPVPVPRAGYWGRLRLNGTPDDMPTFSSAITQYVYETGDMKTQGKWVNAATSEAAPDYVSTIGVIA
jgi:hypothetical protein